MTDKDVMTVFRVLRRYIDSTGYGSWVGDDKLIPVAREAVKALDAARAAAKPKDK